MKATVEPLEGNKVKLSVEVDEAEFEKAVEATLRRISREARIPGFRPGKAPRRLLEARLGRSGVRTEALRDALGDYYEEALRQTELDAIAPPEIDVTAGTEDGAVAFDAVVEVRPRITLAGYQGLRVTVPAVAVTDDDVQRQIDRLRQPFGELKVVERSAVDGDYVTISITGRRGDEEVAGLTADDFLYEVGSAGVVDELDEHLRGAKVGDIVSFDAAIGDGEPVSFRVLVKEIKQMVLPEVTDEWAGEASEFETLAELEADLRARIGAIKKVNATMALRDEVVKALVELVTDEPPEPLVAQEMERRLHDLAHRLQSQGATVEQYIEASGLGREKFVDDLRRAATDAVKADLALRAVADNEALEVTDDDLDGEIAQLGERLGQDAQTVRTQLDRANQLPAVRSDVRKAKALEWLMEHVEIVDEEGNAIDRAQLQPELPDAGAAAEQAGETESDS